MKGLLVGASGGVKYDPGRVWQLGLAIVAIGLGQRQGPGKYTCPPAKITPPKRVFFCLFLARFSNFEGSTCKQASIGSEQKGQVSKL